MRSWTRRALTTNLRVRRTAFPELQDRASRRWSEEVDSASLFKNRGGEVKKHGLKLGQDFRVGAVDVKIGSGF